MLYIANDGPVQTLRRDIELEAPGGICVRHEILLFAYPGDTGRIEVCGKWFDRSELRDLMEHAQAWLRTGSLVVPDQPQAGAEPGEERG